MGLHCTDPMLKVGLTGNMGSGKTVISGIFSILGIQVYNADAESKRFLDSEKVIHELLKHFGYSILTNERTINRRSLASIVFTNENALLVLNSILHPMIMQDFMVWSRQYGATPYVIQEAAILFESGFRNEFDFVIHVSCPKEIAIERVIKRDQIDGNSVLKRIHFQMEDKEKAALSDFVIVNDGSTLIIPQVLSVHQKLLKIGTEGNQDIPSGTADA